MSMLSAAIHQLYNGVSQQPAALRHPSQATTQVNAVSDPARGLRKRPGTKQLAKVFAQDVESVALHVVDRSEDEQYAVLADGASLKVINAKTGQEVPVSFPDGKEYLKTDDPQKDLTFVSAADTTFVVNRRQPVQMRAELVDALDTLSGTVSFPIPAILPPPEEPADPEVEVPSTGRPPRNSWNSTPAPSVTPGEDIGEFPDGDFGEDPENPYGDGDGFIPPRDDGGGRAG